MIIKIIRPHVMFFQKWHSLSQQSQGVGGLQPPHWHIDQNAEQDKYHAFSSFETVLYTEMD